MTDLPRCTTPGCGHPADSHGDRAVIGCVRLREDKDQNGDWIIWTNSLVLENRCPCNGYQSEVPCEDEHLQSGP